MADAPRLLVLTERFRIVELPNGTKTIEKYEGLDAMGVQRWRDLKFGEADATSRMLRDFIFEHAAKCPLLCGGVDESQ